MSNLKDALCLLAIVIAYGIVGRMDYDDAVMLDEAERTTVEADPIACASATDAPPIERPPRTRRSSLDRQISDEPWPSGLCPAIDD